METAGTLVVAAKGNGSHHTVASVAGTEKTRSDISTKIVEPTVCTGLQIAASIATGKGNELLDGHFRVQEPNLQYHI